MVCDAEVGVARGDAVGDGAGEEGGGRGGRERLAAAGEGDVDAAPRRDEVQVAAPRVVGDEEAVVGDAEERLRDVGHVLVLRDEVEIGRAHV